MIYPLVIQDNYWKWSFGIVDLPNLKIVIFQFANCKRLPEGTPWSAPSMTRWRPSSSTVPLWPSASPLGKAVGPGSHVAIGGFPCQMGSKLKYSLGKPTVSHLQLVYPWKTWWFSTTLLVCQRVSCGENTWVSIFCQTCHFDGIAMYSPIFKQTEVKSDKAGSPANVPLNKSNDWWLAGSSWKGNHATSRKKLKKHVYASGLFENGGYLQRCIFVDGKFMIINHLFVDIIFISI